MNRILSGLLIFVLIPVINDAAEARSTDGKTAHAGLKPNILFIIVDDLRPDLGCYGHPLAKTPHIDEIAAEGVTFLRAYCQEAVCTPSRASVMTGRRPDQTEVWNLYTRFREKLPEIETIPEYFKNRGYATTAFGKIYHSQEAYQDPKSWSEPASLYTNDIAQGYFLPENRDLRPTENRPVTGRKMAASEAADVPDKSYPDGKIALAAVDWLNKHTTVEPGKPFFLAVGFHKPHLPFCAPKQYWDLYDRKSVGAVPNPQPPADQLDLALVSSLPELRGYRDIPKIGPINKVKTAELRHGYLACVSFVDAQIGLLMDALERSGKAENTIVVLIGDHGFHLGERGYWCKATNYELDTRVPLIIRAPGINAAGTQSNSLVELVDLYPTLTELANVPPPKGLDGQSLCPLLKNPESTVKAAAYSQFPRPWESADWRKEPRIMGYSVRTDRWRMVTWIDLEKDTEIARELYDHASDPSEMKNLAGIPNWKEIEDLHLNLINSMDLNVNSWPPPLTP